MIEPTIFAEQVLQFSWVEYILDHPGEFTQMLEDHFRMVVFGVSAAILFAIPMGVLATRYPRAESAIMNMGAVIQTIPPLGVIALSFAFLGIGQRPAILAVFLYSVLPILKNTVAGLQNVEDSQIEAARGMGLSHMERFRRIELPLALPVIFAGIRTSIVLSVGVAYLGAFIGGGGFGEWIILGQSMYSTEILLAGAIPGAALVIFLDQTLGWVGDRLSPAGVSGGDHSDSIVA